jgi:ABC-2 type transport system ATP-binding protein
MQPAINIKNVSVTLGSVPALKDVSVELAPGKITGFIGPSGAGKTTLIRSIVGRLKPNSGEISVLGLPAGSAKLRSQLSYMTQDTSIYRDLSVMQNLKYFATMFGLPGSQAKTAINGILESLDMTAQAKQLTSKLSGGQKQRVSLAVALIGQPKIMVLDEPTVGLDPVLRDQIWQLFHKLTSSGTTVIITSHVMDEASRCDDLLLIREGVVLAQGTPQALRERTNSKTVEQSFLKLVGEAK